MKKLRFIVLAIFFIMVNAFSSTTTEIRKQFSYLNSKGKLEKKISIQLSGVVSEIISLEKGIDNLKNRIDKLELNIKSNRSNIEKNYKIITALKSNNKQFITIQKKLQKKLIKIIAKIFSLYLVNNRDFIETKNSIIAEESIKDIGYILKKKFIDISQSYKNISAKISKKNIEIKNIKKNIDIFKKQQKRLLSLKNKHEEAIKKLTLKKINYRNTLLKIKKDKLAIRKTLEKLKILSQTKRIKTQRQKALVERQRNFKNDRVNVRQIGSSYQSSKIKRYNGSKTIAPLKNFIVKRKFGNYIDPIYHIKIFNDSVTLSSKFKDAKVKNILNGKVVFAKDTAVLDKVIIVENSRGIHTIYAHLSKIAPTIQVGKKIKKGYVIGRVDRDLTFEVTQKNFHINPLRLIKLN